MVVTDAHSCTTSGSYSISQPSAALALTTTATNATCHSGNGSITTSVSGGTTAYSYLWNNGATTANLTATAGTYSVTVTDAHGCTISGSKTISAPAAITITATLKNPSTCSANDGKIKTTVTGGISPYTYLWSNGKTTSDIGAPLGIGTYTVTVTDASECTATNSWTLDCGGDKESGSATNNAEVSTGKIMAYPNPTDGLFNVLIPAENKTADILISDISGRVLEMRQITENDGTPIAFSLGNVPPGMYFAKVNAGGQTQNFKIIKR